MKNRQFSYEIHLHEWWLVFQPVVLVFGGVLCLFFEVSSGEIVKIQIGLSKSSCFCGVAFNIIVTGAYHVELCSTFFYLFLKLLQGGQSWQTSVESEIKCQKPQAFPLKFYDKPVSHSPHTHLPLPYPGSVEHWGRVCFNQHCHQWFGCCILRILVSKGN